MRLRYISLLLLLAFVFVPGDIVSAEIVDGHEIETIDKTNLKSFNHWQIEPKDEPLLFDSKGHVTKGVVYFTETFSGKTRIRKRVFMMDSSDGFLYFDSSDLKVKGVNSSSSAKYSILEDYFCPIEGSAGGVPPYLIKYVFPMDSSIITNYGGWLNTPESNSSLSGITGYNMSGSSDYTSLYTNIPIFHGTDSDEYRSYRDNGDYSGASNANDVTTAKKEIYPDNKYENEKGPYLDVEKFDGSSLTIRPAKDAYCTWSYTPKRTDLYTDLTLDVIYDYQLSIEYLNNANVGDTLKYKASGSFPLSDYNFSYNCYPVAVCGRYGWITDSTATALMFGGKATLNVGAAFYGSASATTDLIEVTGSYLTVTFKLKGKYNGDWVNGPAVIQKVDLINRTSTETKAVADDNGNYKVDETTPPVTKDENGNVVINNNVSGGGGGSSATGGNASVTIGDITTSSTFRFPDKITVDLNVNGLGGGGSGGSSSGSDDDGSKKWFDRLLDALGSLLEFFTGAVTKLFEALGDLLTTFADSVGDFIQYLFEGFGLFKKEGGIGSLIQENYSFVPPEVWRLVMFGIASVILVSIVNRFFK